MVSRYFMRSPPSSSRHPPRRVCTLPTAKPSASDKCGAFPLLRIAPAQVLDDPPGVADRLVPDDQERHAVLAGQRVHLFALVPADPALLDLDAAPAQLARHAAARAQPVGRRAAAVEDDALGHRITSRATRPTTRNGSGWGLPQRRSRAPRPPPWERTLASTLSPCGGVA